MTCNHHDAHRQHTKQQSSKLQHLTLMAFVRQKSLDSSSSLHENKAARLRDKEKDGDYYAPFVCGKILSNRSLYSTIKGHLPGLCTLLPTAISVTFDNI